MIIEESHVHHHYSASFRDKIPLYSESVPRENRSLPQQTGPDLSVSKSSFADVIKNLRSVFLLRSVHRIKRIEIRRLQRLQKGLQGFLQPIVLVRIGRLLMFSKNGFLCFPVAIVVLRSVVISYFQRTRRQNHR